MFTLQCTPVDVLSAITCMWRGPPPVIRTSPAVSAWHTLSLAGYVSLIFACRWLHTVTQPHTEAMLPSSSESALFRHRGRPVAVCFEIVRIRKWCEHQLREWKRGRHLVIELFRACDSLVCIKPQRTITRVRNVPAAVKNTATAFFCVYMVDRFSVSRRLLEFRTAGGKQSFDRAELGMVVAQRPPVGWRQLLAQRGAECTEGDSGQRKCHAQHTVHCSGPLSH